MKAFNTKELRGCEHVYSFTLREILFNKANIISAAIMILFSLLSPILLSFFSQDMPMDITDSPVALEKEDGIDKVYIKNETEFTFDLAPYLGGAELYEYEKTAEEFTKNENGVLYHIFFDAETYSYKIKGVCSDSFGGSREGAESFAYTVMSLFDSARYERHGLSSDKTAELFTPSSVNVMNAEDYFKTENDRGFMARFAVQYLFAIIVLVLVAFSATYIVRAVLEEKASKLVETLMVSVRPLALITGKILAVMTYIFGLIFAVVGCAWLSTSVSSKITGATVSLDTLGINLSGIKFDFPTLVLIIIALIISYMTYSVMAGIAGAACSSMEEIESANSSVMFTVLIGYIVSCATCAIPSDTLAVITSLIPVISTFASPAHYVLGNISLGVFLLSLALQAIVAVLLAVFCSRVYAELIMRKGSRVKLREIIKVYFNK